MKQREEIEWVPVSEQFPKRPGPVLVTMRAGYVRELYTDGCDNWTYPSNGRLARRNTITAWASMPRGYRPEEG